MPTGSARGTRFQRLIRYGGGPIFLPFTNIIAPRQVRINTLQGPYPLGLRFRTPLGECDTEAPEDLAP